MLKRSRYLQLSIFLFSIFFLAGCISPKEKSSIPKLLKTENAAPGELLGEVNRFAKINSLRAKMDLKFEDNSWAEIGVAEKYKTADGEVVVQRPAKILLKVQVPVIKTDVAQMTSDGERFRVAVLQDGGSGKYKKFVLGTNSADYSLLQDQITKAEFDESGKALKQNVNAFSNLRPQHFTEAMLVRPIDTENYSYLTSTIFQEEFDQTAKKDSPTRWVVRGYYLLDELRKTDDGTMKIARRFWFDRIGGIRLARQQIYDAKGEIESDIVYGQPGSLGETGEYANLPLQVSVTRPKEKYKMRLTYQTPEAVTIGRSYPEEAFVLQNRWNLEEVDLDKKLQEARGARTLKEATNSASKTQ